MKTLTVAERDQILARIRDDQARLSGRPSAVHTSDEKVPRLVPLPAPPTPASEARLGSSDLASLAKAKAARTVSPCIPGDDGMCQHVREHFGGGR